MTMKVLIVEPGKYPREADIEHTLEAEQEIVGGTIEVVYPWRDRVGIVCNVRAVGTDLPRQRAKGKSCYRQDRAARYSRRDPRTAPTTHRRK